MSVADIRRSYDSSMLDESGLADTPFALLDTWLQEAIQTGILDATAMTLSTVGTNQRPTARIVLLKHYDERGLVFFTNYESRKGLELGHNPAASALFYWSALERQIRVEGCVSKTSAAESDAYFHSRPLPSQVSAWASPQSRHMTRPELEERMAQYTNSLGPTPSRPDFWGGYRLQPEYVEFWQGRASRLHDRIAYTLQASGEWTRTRLAP